MCLVEKRAEEEDDLTRFRYHRCSSRSLQRQIWCVSSDAPYAERSFQESAGLLSLMKAKKVEIRCRLERHFWENHIHCGAQYVVVV